MPEVCLAELGHAYRVLGLKPGVLPLAARRRYRDLIKQWHPDRCPHGSPSQLEATRRTQEINAAYRTLKGAARHRQVPLRAPRPSGTPPTPGVVSLSETTVADRVVSAIAGVFVGFFVGMSLMPQSAVVWIGVPLVLGVAGALLGWRPLEVVVRLMWWLV
jgi:preprotein translocase subunit Sec63